MKVLIIDNSILELEILKGILNNSEIEIEVSTNSDNIEEFSPDLILLDLYMPIKSGYDICLSIKSNPKLCNIPIVILSSSTDLNDKISCFYAGAIDYIEKPSTPENLVQAIKKYARIGEIYRAGENIRSINKEATD
jgi:DNA-binding response OmpR family regulator